MRGQAQKALPPKKMHFERGAKGIYLFGATGRLVAAFHLDTGEWGWSSAFGSLYRQQAFDWTV